MIKVFTFENKGDNKGPVINFDFSDTNVVEIPVFYRKKGENPDGHFHKEGDASYDPQKIYVLSGKLEFTCIDLNGDEEIVIVSERQGIVLPLYVYHRYKVLEEAIFCEPRLEKYSFDKIHKYNLEEFRKLISEHKS